MIFQFIKNRSLNNKIYSLIYKFKIKERLNNIIHRNQKDYPKKKIVLLYLENLI